jgi:hypothetical protein
MNTGRPYCDPSAANFQTIRCDPPGGLYGAGFVNPATFFGNIMGGDAHNIDPINPGCWQTIDNGCTNTIDGGMFNTINNGRRNIISTANLNDRYNVITNGDMSCIINSVASYAGPGGAHCICNGYTSVIAGG